jgi:hypothetical protein
MNTKNCHRKTHGNSNLNDRKLFSDTATALPTQHVCSLGVEATDICISCEHKLKITAKENHIPQLEKMDKNGSHGYLKSAASSLVCCNWISSGND